MMRGVDDSDSIRDDRDSIRDDRNLEIFIRTFHNGDYDAELNDLISRRPPPDTPMQVSYNKPDNWRERNQLGLETVKKQLQTCIHSVSYDKTVNLTLDHNRYLDQDAAPIVWHEPILDHYWDQLENEIDRRRQQGLVTYIIIQNVEMKKERLASLADALCGKVGANTYIKFTNVNLCNEGIISLSRLVINSSQLTRLFVNHNRIDNMESARCLSRSLKSHARIIELHLTHCDLGSSPEILSVILQSEVKYINLDYNSIDSFGAVKIAEYLEGDPPIKELSLRHNRLNDNDAILISQAMRRNTNLRYLHLLGNNLTSTGVKALLTCVFDSSSLNAISESNHTMVGMNIFLKGENERLDCIRRLIKMNRAQKIMLALQDKDSLLKYLANVPVELIPEVLAFPRRQEDQRQRRYLNILYSTMRWWNMPMLYSYHNPIQQGLM
jgi:hypothetical protein